jgi:hypothetical protein
MDRSVMGRLSSELRRAKATLDRTLGLEGGPMERAAQREEESGGRKSRVLAWAELEEGVLKPFSIRRHRRPSHTTQPVVQPRRQLADGSCENDGTGCCTGQ